MKESVLWGNITWSEMEKKIKLGIAKCRGIRIPEFGKFSLVESGVLFKESGIQLTIGISNLTSSDKNPESSTWNPESPSSNPESKTILDFFTLGDI